MTSNERPRFCRETQTQLPALVAGELTGWPARVVRAHLKHCDVCSGELDRQRKLATTLQALRDSPPEPPAALLENLLQLNEKRTVRQRIAIPTRGAVSGARPALSVAYLTAGAAASTGLGWALWRGVRKLRSR